MKILTVGDSLIEHRYFLYMTSEYYSLNLLYQPYQLVPSAGWWCMCVYWQKFSLLILAISLEQTDHLGRRSANTNYKHQVWEGGNQSSFIYWTWLKRCKFDSKVIPLNFHLLHSIPSPVILLIGENLNGKPHGFLSSLSFQKSHKQKWTLHHPLPSNLFPYWGMIVGVSIIPHNT